MGKKKRERYASYRPMPNKSRFWLHAENCYTQEDLDFREWVIKTRSNSGIHPDYLGNPDSWFATDHQQALVNVYENSWFYSTAYRTRHILTRDNFHVQPIDGPRPQWPSYKLMQQVGDYLLLRNKDLSAAHLNQPMNYVFLDLNFMLKSLSQNSNVIHVKEQLELITRYLRTIEKNISPVVGSDRLFLANFRSVINDEVHPHLTHLIESQLLQEKLRTLSMDMANLSAYRNRLLHFSLSANQVNPHPYEFSIAMPDDLSAYPTQAARACGQTSRAIESTKVNVQSTELRVQSPERMQLDARRLNDCPHFKLIYADEEAVQNYARAVTDLDDLEHFQIVIDQIVNLLGQAGEVYTVHQFKEQMLTLLNQINTFIDDSFIPIEAIINANTQAYHKAIQDQQDLSYWKLWLTSEQELLKTFIKNQDTLAQFPSSASELIKTNKAAQTDINELIRRLNQPKSTETSIEAVRNQAQALDQIMGSMHHWVQTQQQLKGLATTLPPLQLLESSAPAVSLPNPTGTTLAQRFAITDVTHDTVLAPPVSCTPLRTYNSSSFFSPQVPLSSPDACAFDDMNCQQQCTASGARTNTFALGIIVIIPVALLIYLLFSWKNYKPEPPAEQSSQNNKTGFDRLMNKVEDLIAKIRGFEQETDQDLSDDYRFYLDDYEKFKKEARSGIYNLRQLREHYRDLKFFFNDSCTTKTELSL